MSNTLSNSRTLPNFPLRVKRHQSTLAMARAAADEAANTIRLAVEENGVANVMFATGNSQLQFIELLTDSTPDIPWQDVIVFHMDEYIGIGPNDQPGFQRWIRERITLKTSPREAFYINGLNDPLAECARYAQLLEVHPLDLCCLGIGENGHLAFNDPGVADFDDPHTIKVVELDTRCRLQQVNESHFDRLEEVPSHAITATIPTLLRAKHLIGVVPDDRKSEAVYNALKKPLSTSCPASSLTTHTNATLHLDPGSSCLLERD